MNTRNKVQLIGHLGMNPEIRDMEKGNKLAKMSVATNEVYTNNKGERITDTEWHQVVAWGKTAEIAAQLLQKGTEVMIEGKLTHREFTGTDGVKRRLTEIVASSFLVLEKKQSA